MLYALTALQKASPRGLGLCKDLQLTVYPTGSVYLVLLTLVVRY